MICAYDVKYLDEAMEKLGEALDYATNCCGMSMDNFVDCFIGSGLALEFENGNPKYVAGISGTELVLEVIEKTRLDISCDDIQIEYDYSPQYWCGWVLAYYQWVSGKSFKEIKQYISMEDVKGMYPTLHEASEEKTAEIIDEIITRKSDITKLQMQRRICGYSQRILAEKARVNLRTLQQYELGSKDINKASVGTLLALSKVLGCKIEDLLE